MALDSSAYKPKQDAIDVASCPRGYCQHPILMGTQARGWPATKNVPLS